MFPRFLAVAMTFFIFGLNLNSVFAGVSYNAFVKFNPHVDLHYGVYAPEGETKGDILFLHGFGDNYENHGPLFKEWNQAGFRVISFDFPSHGKTTNTFLGDLNCMGFEDLNAMAVKVLGLTLEDSDRPLLLAGWSTGGLLAVRMVQAFSASLEERSPQGLILFAPGVSVKPCVGNAICQITNDTLTHNTALQKRAITPEFPAMKVKFAAKLLFNAMLSWDQPLPAIPVLTFVAGEDDRYVQSNKIKEWVKKQNKNTNVIGIQCPRSKHELDNEPAFYGGEEVRSLSVAFAKLLLNPSENQEKLMSFASEVSQKGICTKF